MTDWEKRARELFGNNDEGGMHLWKSKAVRDLALQLGREMAAEAAKMARGAELARMSGEYADMRSKERMQAADARAEEIAKAIERNWSTQFGKAYAETAAQIARSTIKKPEQTPLSPLTATEDSMCELLESALSRWVKDHTGVECASVTVTRKTKPKTREQVLEEALRKLQRCTCGVAQKFPNLPAWDALHHDGCAYDEARRALEWRP